MVVVGIVGIVALIMSRMTSGQLVAEKVLQERMAVIDLTRVLMTTFADNQTCTAMLTDPNVTSGAPFKVKVNDPEDTPPINLQKISDGPGSSVVKVGEPASTLNKNVVVDKIVFKNFEKVVTKKLYTAELVITFEGGTLKKMAPVVIKNYISTDSSGEIQGCGKESAGQTITRIGGYMRDTTENKVEVGDNPLNIGNCWCHQIDFEPNISTKKMLVVGSTTYGSGNDARDADTHMFSYFGVALNSFLGTGYMCLDAGPNTPTLEFEILNWWILNYK